jgi:hypothetical protein
VCANSFSRHQCFHNTLLADSYQTGRQPPGNEETATVILPDKKSMVIKTPRIVDDHAKIDDE